MDDSVQRSMDKFPNTPVVYGWLRLDRRGVWWIRTARMDHHKIRAFIGRNYSVDERGCYYFQNGAQRVFVEIEVTPWIYSVEENEDHSLRLMTHTDLPVEQVIGAFLTDSGDLMLETEFGAGLVNDRDLIRIFGLMCGEDGQLLDDDAVSTELELLLEKGSSDKLFIEYANRRVPVKTIDSESIANTYKFISKPTKASSAKQ